MKQKRLTSEDKHRLSVACDKYAGDRRFWMVHESVYTGRPIAQVIRKWRIFHRWNRQRTVVAIDNGELPEWLRPQSDTTMSSTPMPGWCRRHDWRSNETEFSMRLWKEDERYLCLLSKALLPFVLG